MPANSCIVYSRGRSGTQSIYRSLQEHGKIKLLAHEETHEAEYISYSDKYITMIREPISRNVSDLFWSCKVKFGVDPNDLSNEELVKMLVGYYDREPSYWLDENIKKILCINVFNHSFPKKKGWKIIDNLLILRTDMNDDGKGKIISPFLGISGFKIKRCNEASERDFASKYEEFKKCKLPREYVNNQLESKYTRKFFTDEEIENARWKWSE